MERYVRKFEEQEEKIADDKKWKDLINLIAPMAFDMATLYSIESITQIEGNHHKIGFLHHPQIKIQPGHIQAHLSNGSFLAVHKDLFKHFVEMSRGRGGKDILIFTDKVCLRLEMF